MVNPTQQNVSRGTRGGMELGILRCGKCERKYIGEECPFCAGRAGRKGPHPPEHVEGECEYCAPIVADPVASGDMSPVDVATLCSDCGEREPQPGRKVCAGCRQAAYRGRKS